MILEIIFIAVVIIEVLVNMLVFTINNMCREEENGTKLTGFEVAKIVSDKLSDKEPHIIKGSLKNLDHYNIDRNVIKLSSEVFDGTNIYCATIAIAAAYDTKEANSKILQLRKISTFLAMAFYVVLAIGAVLNNTSMIYFSFILFIIGFILECIELELYLSKKHTIESLEEEIQKCNVIKPFDEFKDFVVLGFAVYVANYPYRFLNYFRK